MNKRYISANLTVLKTWLIGGQVDGSGNYEGGFNTFTEFADTLKTREDVQETILHFIDSYGDHPCGEGDSGEDETFSYWGDSYKFKRPSQKGLEKLTDIVLAKVKEYQTV